MSKLNNDINLMEAKMNYATILNKQNKIDEALKYTLEVVTIQEQSNRVIPLDYVLLGRLYFKKHDMVNSKYFFEKALSIAKNDADKISIYNSYTAFFKEVKDYKNAIACLDSINEISGRISQQEFADKTKELEESYRLKIKDENINKLELLNQKASDSLKIRTLIIGLLILLSGAVVAFIIINNKNKRLKLNNEKVIVEQKLFNAQISPHFMFNTLSAIQAEILMNNNKVANNYLTKFGQLMQNILFSTTQEYIAINLEYKNLINYIDLQSIRFKNFTYECDVYNGITEDEDLICPLLIQPLIENAIHHGLSNLKYPGELKLIIEKHERFLNCIIEDNGEGLKQKENSNRKLSVSTGLIKKRLEVLSKQFKVDCKLTIENKPDNRGVRTNIQIPFQEN